MDISNAELGNRKTTRGSHWLTGLLLLTAVLCAHIGPAQAAKTITYYYTSPEGTVLAKADNAGNAISSSEYRPYGSQALSAAEDGPGYAGHVSDTDSGLVYMQARYYDAEMGRFLSTDPISPAPGDLFGFARYSYASGNPISGTDPTGMADDCGGPACRKLRELADSMGISGALRTAVGGSGGPMGQVNSGLNVLNGSLEQAAASDVRNVSGGADSVPGASALACASGANCTTGEIIGSVVGSVLPLEFEALEISAVNKMFASGGAYRSVETVVANMSYREGAVSKAAVAIRDIAGGHLFYDGNKRTAQAVAERVLSGRVDPGKVRAVVDAAANGRLKSVEDISHALQH